MAWAIAAGAPASWKLLAKWNKTKVLTKLRHRCPDWSLGCRRVRNPRVLKRSGRSDYWLRSWELADGLREGRVGKVAPISMEAPDEGALGAA